VIDLGPEGGDGGGELVANGTPEDVAREEDSHTGRYLRDMLPAVDIAGPRDDDGGSPRSRTTTEPRVLRPRVQF